MSFEDIPQLLFLFISLLFFLFKKKKKKVSPPPFVEVQTETPLSPPSINVNKQESRPSPTRRASVKSNVTTDNSIRGKAVQDKTNTKLQKNKKINRSVSLSPKNVKEALILSEILKRPNY